MKNKTDTLVLFDFDGTITNKDSLLEFFKHTHGIKAYLYLLLMVPIFVFYKLQFLSNNRAKEIIFSFFYKNCSKTKFKDWASSFSSEVIPKILYKQAQQKIKWHLENNHKVIIVSATIENFISQWCTDNDILLIATKIEFQENKVNGKFATKNCYGQEKVNRITKLVNIENFKTIFAYGNSRGDKEMLELGNQSFYKPFNY
jgi:HAD superfamily hydrolase (TIGR01490 family)